MRSAVASRAVSTSTGSGVAGAAQAAQHLQTIHARQAEIQHAQVETLVAQRMQRAGAVLQPVHRVALGLERGAHALAQRRIVLHQQNPHPHLLRHADEKNAGGGTPAPPPSVKIPQPCPRAGGFSGARRAPDRAAPRPRGGVRRRPARDPVAAARPAWPSPGPARPRRSASGAAGSHPRSTWGRSPAGLSASACWSSWSALSSSPKPIGQPGTW